MHVQGTRTSDSGSTQLDASLAAGEGLTDETLVKAFQNGDREAFGAVYARYADKVAGYVYKRRPSASPEDRQDLMCEIFARVLETIGEFTDSGRDGSFSRWLFTRAARYVLYTDGKAYWEARQIYFRSVDQLSRQYREDDTEAEADTAPELSASWRAAIEDLHPHHRRVIELYYLEELTIEQISEIMAITPRQAVDFRRYALRKLRDPGKHVKFDRAATTARLLAAARQLTAEQGTVTTTAIAEAAGVTRGLVYHYFGSQQNLVKQACGVAA